MTVRTLTLLILFFFLQGCDTSGEEFDTSGFETVDNSELASFFNAYGYYGEDVMFGKQLCLVYGHSIIPLQMTSSWQVFKNQGM